MTSYARITKSQSTLWLRFGRIGGPDAFDRLLAAFRFSFPMATWDHLHRGWQLPPEQLERVTLFCRRNDIQVCLHDTMLADIGQLALW